MEGKKKKKKSTFTIKNSNVKKFIITICLYTNDRSMSNLEVTEPTYLAITIIKQVRTEKRHLLVS